MTKGYIHSIESCGTVDGPGTVSYTHLDVYKRQPLISARKRNSNNGNHTLQ